MIIEGSHGPARAGVVLKQQRDGQVIFHALTGTQDRIPLTVVIHAASGTTVIEPVPPNARPGSLSTLDQHAEEITANVRSRRLGTT